MLSWCASAQNLVPNSSFEFVTLCPEQPSMLPNAVPWFSPDNYNSTDLFNECVNNNLLGVPINYFGFQYSHSGEGYAGLYSKGTNKLYREYMEVQLMDSLTEGKCYRTEFYFSAADSISNVFVKSMGVYFSVDSLLGYNLYDLNALEDTTDYNEFNYDDWYHFTIDYLAFGGEQFLTLGNFNDNESLDTIYNSQLQLEYDVWRNGYFYIDDVSVTEIDYHSGCRCLYEDVNGVCMEADILGCMDPLACNYNPIATEEDNSCTYGSNNYVAATACNSYTWLGDTYTESGTYYHNFELTEECDSSVFLHLTINDAPSSDQTIVICEGDSAVVGDSIFTISGNYTSVIPTLEECDSLVFTELIVLETSVIEQSQQICQGDSVIVGDTAFFESGVFNVPLEASNGCDSIVKLSLTVLDNYNVEQSLEICQGDSIVVGDSIYYESGVFTNLLQSAGGCDSIVQTDLTVSTTPLSVLNIDNDLHAIPEDYDSYIWSTSETEEVITPVDNGMFWVLATDENNCTSDTAFFEVDFIGIYTNELNTSRVYPNPASDKIYIEGRLNGLVRLYDIQGKLIMSKEKASESLILDVQNLSRGEYLLKLNDEVFRVVKN